MAESGHRSSRVCPKCGRVDALLHECDVKPSPFDARSSAVWHVISSDDLLALLRRVAAGEDPEFVYLEEYVNADREEMR